MPVGSSRESTNLRDSAHLPVGTMGSLSTSLCTALAASQSPFPLWFVEVELTGTGISSNRFLCLFGEVGPWGIAFLGLEVQMCGQLMRWKPAGAVCLSPCLTWVF